MLCLCMPLQSRRMLPWCPWTSADKASSGKSGSLQLLLAVRGHACRGVDDSFWRMRSGRT